MKLLETLSLFQTAIKYSSSVFKTFLFTTYTVAVLDEIAFYFRYSFLVFNYGEVTVYADKKAAFTQFKLISFNDKSTKHLASRFN